MFLLLLTLLFNYFVYSNTNIDINNLKIKINEKPLVVIIPSYNNKYWYQRNLDSVFKQKYNNYRVIYIDDVSNDKTPELVEHYIKERQQEHRVKLIKNKEKKLALKNLYEAIHTCKPEEIIVCLDGDDWLTNEYVFAYLNYLYQDPNTWLTYGQFRWYPYSIDADWKCCKIPDYIIEHNLFRESDWMSSHLRTFYAALFHKIKKEDLLFFDKFYPMAWDLAMMFPMLEMSGHHSKFIPYVLYIYNDATPINDYKTNKNLQIELDMHIRSKPKYQKLDTLFDNKSDSLRYTATQHSGCLIENNNRHFECFYESKNVSRINKKIYIYPGQWVDLFDINHPILNRDDARQPMYQLKQNLEKQGYEIIQANDLSNLHDAQYIITFDIPVDQIEHLKKYPKEKLIAYLWEPPSVDLNNYNESYHIYYNKIYTWKDDLIDNKKYFKFYYPVLRKPIEDNRIINFKNKKLCTFISSNKYSEHPDSIYNERYEIIKFFENLESNDFNFYGKYWEKNNFKNYKGQVNNKIEVLKNYKFCICYENIKNISGYVTEKIIDCLLSYCVPIYQGASNIKDYIPGNCFIDRNKFKDNLELYNYLKNMKEDEYQIYIDNIKKFLKSSDIQIFSIENFIKIFNESLH